MQIFRSLVVSLSASLMVLAASSAQARDIWPPPAKYDSGPLLNPQFQTPIITHLARAELTTACEGKHLACSYVAVGQPCRIFLPVAGWQPMVRHEMGHCRGWSADHQS